MRRGKDGENLGSRTDHVGPLAAVEMLPGTKISRVTREASKVQNHVTEADWSTDLSTDCYFSDASNHNNNMAIQNISKKEKEKEKKTN